MNSPITVISVPIIGTTATFYLPRLLKYRKLTNLLTFSPMMKNMRHSLIKIGLPKLALLTLFVFSVGIAGGFANDFSDFEKLLREATAGQNSAASGGTASKQSQPSARGTDASAEKSDQTSPAPGAPVTRSTNTKPAPPNGAAGQKPAAGGKSASPSSSPSASPETIADGWTTIQPNAPGIVVPDTRTVLPPPARMNVQIPPAELFTVLGESDQQGESEEPAELFEPDPVKGGGDKAPATASEPLVSDEMFDEVFTVIEGEEFGEAASNSVSPSEEGDASESLGAITEPRKVGASKSAPGKDSGADTPSGQTPSRRTPVRKDELSAILDGLASEQIEEESEDEGGHSVPTDTADSATVPEKTQVTVGIPDFDSDNDETVWKVINASLVGDPNSHDKLKLMYDEILNGLRTRNVTGRYEMWKGFSKNILRDTAGINTASELDGRSRLPWYEKLYAEPFQSTFEVEEYSRVLYSGLSGTHRHLAELMPGIRERMDVAKREDGGIRFPVCTTPMEALLEVKRCLLLAASAHARAFSGLTSAELTELDKTFVETFVGKSCINGHTIPARSVGRKHVDIFERVDKSALYDGAEALIPLTNTALLDLLAQLPEDALPQVMLGGQKVQRLCTGAGDIIIGGRGRNVYDLDAQDMRDVICVISFGEDDAFREGTCNMNRPVFVVMALGKKNTFVGSKPGIQGGSIMGISMLLDRAASSTYTAVDVAQGSTMGGVGILINYEGTNSYKAMRRVQGHALLGLGMLIDKGAGNASYKASLWAQGFGAPGGFGVLANSGGGNNHYYCGGLYLDSYPEHPGYDGWGQGIGAGIRQVANGGIGVILSGAGDDIYEVDYFGHGGGYWLGVGIARDFGGNDMRHGTTLATYNGTLRIPGNRVESKWTRFANGFGCHYALGYCFDDGGDDLFGGQIMGTGMAWDLAYAILCSFNGNGKYTATGNMTQGVGAEGSIGVLFSYGGNDTFASRSQGFANSNITYHPPACGGNISFLINYGGENTYGSKVARHTYAQRGTPSGFVIDRPTEKEAATISVSLRQAVEARNREIAEYDAMVAQMKEEAAQKRRPYYPPRQRRPVPLSDSQLIGAVPDFDPNIRKADASEMNVK